MGWTLVELLVVVAIISILMALMMPAYMKARRMADRVECLNGQRVWETNSAMEELTVADRSRLAKCWDCHPSVP